MYFLNTKNNKKGFTLIELLVTISIISLLSSVIFTVLDSARVKAKDVAIEQEVSELGKVIEQSFLNGNYSNYGETGLWLGGFVNKNCSNLTGNMATEAQRICAAIYKIGVGNFGDPGLEYQFLIGITEYKDATPWVYVGPRYDLYSITVKLNSGKIFCLSNIGTYEGYYPWTAGTGNNHPCYYYLTP